MLLDMQYFSKVGIVANSEFHTKFLGGKPMIGNSTCVEYTAPMGGLGACSPRKFVKFRSSEVASRAPESY